MIIQIILLLLGFVLLIKGADVFVEGASDLAYRLKVPQMVIGLTIVAFGTSAPEAAVSLTSAIQGNSSIGIGNVIGSNIANVLLILGVVGLFSDLSMKRKTYLFEIPFVIVISILLIVLGYLGERLSTIDGVILLLFFAFFFVYLFSLVKEDKDNSLPIDQNNSVFILLLFIIIGIVSVIVGSRVLVDSASFIARYLGISERVIGLTIVAIGTSLPELMTSLLALKKGKDDIAVGNVIGSNIFNILFILGISALLAPHGLYFDSSFLIDGGVSVFALVLFYVFIDKNFCLKKSGALFMFISYIVYLFYLV